MNIAICDDDTISLQALTMILQTHAARTCADSLQIHPFHSTHALLSHITRFPHTIDLFILDVLMPEQNGIQLGEELRRRSENAPIIYLTSSPDYAIQACNHHAYAYLLKPIEPHALLPLIDKLCSTTPEYPIHTPSGTRLVPIHTILSAELTHHTVLYTLTDGTTVQTSTIRSSFRNEIAPLLNSPDFALTSVSHLINLNYVTSLEKTSCSLSGSTVVPISRTRYNDFKSRLAAHRRS